MRKYKSSTRSAVFSYSWTLLVTTMSAHTPHHLDNDEDWTRRERMAENTFVFLDMHSEPNSAMTSVAVDASVDVDNTRSNALDTFFMLKTSGTTHESSQEREERDLIRAILVCVVVIAKQCYGVPQAER